MRKGLILIALATFLAHCATVPITGRKQVKLLSTSEMTTMSFSEYEKVKKSSNLLPDSDPRVIMVKSVGIKISNAVTKFLIDNKMNNRLEEFKWEFNVTEEGTVNAWCMPGGKVMFYTGILEVCDGEEGIAVVMGHEVAHAVARHGNERMSQQMGVQGLGVGMSVLMSENPTLGESLFLKAFGIGSQVGMLKYSRLHESEADKMGLVFMTMAGYDPNSAVEFWERMSANKGGQAPPEFLSTHPSDETRIKDLQDFIPKAKELANK